MHNVRKRGEWLAVPNLQGILARRRRAGAMTAHGARLYVQLLPAPNRTWQWCRVDLDKPFARGFADQEQARRWLASAVAAGIVPEVVELEGQGADAKERHLDVPNPKPRLHGRRRGHGRKGG
jgi:hypothetical protein